MVNGVIIDDEIVGVVEGQSRMTASCERVWWQRRTIVSDGMHVFLWQESILNTVACGRFYTFLTTVIFSAVGGRWFRAAAETDGGHLFTFCKIPTPIMAAATLAASLLGARRRYCVISTMNYFSGGARCRRFASRKILMPNTRCCY